MYKVGITGGIGSGKSTVCGILEALGVPVYYADVEARRLMNEDEGLREDIRDLLGGQVYREGRLDTRMVAQRVFGDTTLLGELNKLVHPAVRRDFQSWIKSIDSAPYVVEEAAILFESGSHAFLDLNVLVYAPLELRMSRVMNRDGVSREEVEKRMARQMDEEEKKKRADIVVLNDEKDMLLPRVVSLHHDILMKV